MATCPICKMEVNENTTKFKTEKDGEIHYFCSEVCKEQFEKTN